MTRTYDGYCSEASFLLFQVPHLVFFISQKVKHSCVVPKGSSVSEEKTKQSKSVHFVDMLTGIVK